jgi:hypothetical protein
MSLVSLVAGVAIEVAEEVLGTPVSGGAAATEKVTGSFPRWKVNAYGFVGSKSTRVLRALVLCPEDHRSVKRYTHAHVHGRCSDITKSESVPRITSVKKKIALGTSIRTPSARSSLSAASWVISPDQDLPVMGSGVGIAAKSSELRLSTHAPTYMR